jgi:uncharacterized protein (TIGR02466 family)
MIKELPHHKLFPTPIWGYVLTNSHYQAIDYVNKIREIQQTEPSVKKSNFSGYQSRDNLHEEPIFQELVKYEILPLAQDIMNTYSNVKVKMDQMWANINDKYSCNQSHIHSGLLSGVFYLQTPENCGQIVFCNPAVRSNYHIIKEPDYGVPPQRLACLFFPSWLEHYVEPNSSDESRISISFNIGEIYE